MAAGSGDKRRSVLVPFEVESFLRAPYGWTNRMRREEGHPARGESRSVPIGLWANILLGLALYGPVVVGGVLGWHAQGSLWGAGLGVIIGLVAAMVLGLFANLVMAFLDWRRSH